MNEMDKWWTMHTQTRPQAFPANFGAFGYFFFLSVHENSTCITS